MNRRVWRAGTAVLAAGLVAVAACGKRGDPLPPLRPVPGVVEDLRIRRSPDGVEVSFTVPASNADGTTPAAVDRVEVFAATRPADAPPVTGQQLSADAGNLIARIPVRQSEPSDAAAAADEAALGLPTSGPGERAVLGDRVATPDVPSVRYYVAVGVAGAGQGRAGRPSAVVAVPWTALPPPPGDVVLTHDERETQVSWTASTDGQRFQVFALDTSVTPPTAVNLTPDPGTDPSFSLPVEFGTEVCVSVVSLQITGPVTIQGSPSPVACLVPVDTYPPPAPTGLQVVQDGTAVTVIWSAVDAPDLAGYVVLRGEGNGDDLRPLFRQPQAGTTYRDASVSQGTAYTYAVYAVDDAQTPNVSELSTRRVVTVR